MAAGGSLLDGVQHAQHAYRPVFLLWANEPAGLWAPAGSTAVISCLPTQ